MALAPVQPPLGIFQDYYATRPTTLVLKEKILSWTGVSHSALFLLCLGSSGAEYVSG